MPCTSSSQLEVRTHSIHIIQGTRACELLWSHPKELPCSPPADAETEEHLPSASGRPFQKRWVSSPDISKKGYDDVKCCSGHRYWCQNAWSARSYRGKAWSQDSAVWGHGGGWQSQAAKPQELGHWWECEPDLNTDTSRTSRDFHPGGKKSQRKAWNTGSSCLMHCWLSNSAGFGDLSWHQPQELELVKTLYFRPLQELQFSLCFGCGLGTGDCRYCCWGEEREQRSQKINYQLELMDALKSLGWFLSPCPAAMSASEAGAQLIAWQGHVSICSWHIHSLALLIEGKSLQRQPRG